MTLSVQEISDRIEIQDVLVAYTHAVDTRDFDGLDEVFTADAVIDLTATGGPSGDLASTKEFLRQALPAFRVSQHMLGQSRVVLRGDEAEARTICHNPMVLDDGDRTQVWFLGIWYADRLVRTPQGWRIRERRIESSHNVLGLAHTPLGG
jgi:hypothetical protein